MRGGDIIFDIKFRRWNIAYIKLHCWCVQRDMCVCVEVWEEVWQEGTPGSEGGIRLYLSEIMEVLPKVNHHCWPYLDFKMRHKYRSLHFFIWFRHKNEVAMAFEHAEESSLWTEVFINSLIPEFLNLARALLSILYLAESRQY